MIPGVREVADGGSTSGGLSGAAKHNFWPTLILRTTGYRSPNWCPYPFSSGSHQNVTKRVCAKDSTVGSTSNPLKGFMIYYLALSCTLRLVHPFYSVSCTRSMSHILSYVCRDFCSRASRLDHEHVVAPIVLTIPAPSDLDVSMVHPLLE